MILNEMPNHASLECPCCGKICKPHKEHGDGSATYICDNNESHPDFNPLIFKIDEDGEVEF